MPKYCVIVTNVSNHASRSPMTVGASQVEYCTAPDAATAELIVRHNIARTDNPDLYSWTITEQTD